MFCLVGPSSYAQDQPVEPSKYELLVDMPGFKETEIKVTIKDGYLVVHGKQETEDPVFGFQSNEAIKKYQLPSKLDLDKLTYVSKESGGIIKIKGHFKMPSILSSKFGERVIPITVQRNEQTSVKTK